MRAALLLALVLGAFASGCATAGPTVVLVRHAEKADDSKDPPLTAKGHQRAKALQRLLSRTGVDAIYSSEYQRTQATVAPLSDATGIRTEVISAREPEVLLEKLRSHAPDDVVVVAGHSNTVPDLIAQLGAEVPPAIEHHEYDRVFLVTLRPNGPPVVVELAFGDESVEGVAPMEAADDEDTVDPVPASVGGESDEDPAPNGADVPTPVAPAEDGT